MPTPPSPAAEVPSEGVAGAEARAVRQRWEPLGVPGIVDIHTHFMPGNVLDKVWAYFDAAGPLVGREWPITYRHAEEERVALLRAFGVRAFTALVYPHRPAMAAWLTSWSVDFAARTPGALGCVTFYPEPRAAQGVTDAIDRGARVAKVHVQVGDFDVCDPLLDATWGVLAEAGLPVVLHAGSGPAPGRFTGPGPVAELLRRHPRLRLVVAHLGMPEYADFMELAEAYEGVHLDTTMAFTGFVEDLYPFPAELRPRLLALGEKVLFGSDFPNIPYPYTEAIDGLVRLDLGDDWLRAVLHDNGARLLGL